ncbi:Uncharacterised protein [Klebsiella pneumoniae]|nr:Uncharacterised protein [Klebsiella pneumoniae]
MTASTQKIMGITKISKVFFPCLNEFKEREACSPSLTPLVANTPFMMATEATVNMFAFWTS